MERNNKIHPTAILEGDIKLGSNNIIGPNVVLKGDIEIGNHNILDTGVCLENHVVIGNDNHLYPYVCIGAAGEMGAKGDRLDLSKSVIIGNRVTLREFVCVHSPVHHPSTEVMDDVYIMNKSYVAHDCRIGNGVVMSAGVLMGGRCELGAYSNIGLGAVIHQRLHIGERAMVGMQSVITHDIVPYALVAGSPARLFRLNRMAAEREGLDENWIVEMEKYFAQKRIPEDESFNPIMKKIKVFIEEHPDSLRLFTN